MGSGRIPTIILEWNAEGKSSPREKLKHGQQRHHRKRCREHRLVADQIFVGLKDTYCTVKILPNKILVLLFKKIGMVTTSKTKKREDLEISGCRR